MRCTVRLIPNFDISPENLDIDKYQVRKTKRTELELKRLKNMIEVQGQVEPIQIVKQNDKYFLMAGAGRVQCLRELGMTAKALVYEGISHDDILKIAIGTNEGRVEMSAWDRMVSIGEYVDSNNNIDPQDFHDMSSLVGIFGRSTNNIIRDYDLWKFYSEIDGFVELFNERNVPLYVLVTVDEILNPYKEDITSYDTVIDILKKIIKPAMSAKQFTNVFVKEITEFLITIKKKQSVKQNVYINDGMNAQELSDVEKFTRTKLMQKTYSEKQVYDDNIVKKCETVMNTLLKQCEHILEIMNRLKKLPYKDKLSSDYMLKLSKLITKINQTGIKLL